MKMIDALYQAKGIAEAMLDFGRDVCTVLASVLSRLRRAEDMSSLTSVSAPLIILSD